MPARWTVRSESDPRYGKIAGTADYLSPDQIRDPRSPAPAWDIYSLGCTLYYAVTGKVPFPGGTTADKARAHCELRPLDPRRLRDMIAHLDSSSKSLDDALHHIDNTTTRIDEGKGTIGRLTKDETLINEVQGVVEGVNDYVGGIARLQTIVGLRTDYNFLANTIKSYVELRLQPREDKYYVIELINDPRGLTSITQHDVDTTNPDPAVALPRRHDHDDQLVPLLAPVRASGSARSRGASASRSRRAASGST